MKIEKIIIMEKLLLMEKQLLSIHLELRKTKKFYKVKKI